MADDELFFLDVVKENLEYLGYRVTACRSGLKVLEAFRQDPDQFDLVVTDQTMPEMTGVQLVSEIRTYNRRIPIILCTGYSDLVTEQSARHHHVSKFIMKPIGIRDLARAVHDAIAGSCAEPGINP